MEPQENIEPQVNEEELERAGERIEQIKQAFAAGEISDVDFAAEMTELLIGILPAFSVLRPFIEISRQAGQAYREGQYEKAMQLMNQAPELHRQAVEKLSEAFGTDVGEQLKAMYAVALHQSGTLHLAMGNYSEAVKAMQQAIDLYSQTGAELNPQYAKALNDLATIQLSSGNYRKAEKLILQSLAEMEAIALAFSNNDADAAAQFIRRDTGWLMANTNLANVYYCTGRYEEARAISDLVIECYRAAGATGHEGYALCLNNQAMVYFGTENYQAAVDLLKQAMDVYAALGLTEHPDYGRVLVNLSHISRFAGQYDTAGTFAGAAFSIFIKALGLNHPDVAGVATSLALISVGGEANEAAIKFIQAAEIIYDHVVGEIFSIATESQRMAYINQLKYHTAIFLSLVREHFSADQAAIQSALDLVFKRKAIGAEAHVSQRDAVLKGRFPELKPRLKEWAALRAQIAQKTLAGPGPEGVEEHERLLAEWEARKERAESDLAAQIPEIKLQQKSQSVIRVAIARELPAGAALIEFFRFHVFDFKALIGNSTWKPERYIAFVLLSGEPDNIQMIDLGEAETVDSLIAAFRESLTGEGDLREARNLTVVTSNRSQGLRTGYGDALRKAVFDPLIPHLSDRKRLYISPDGDLARLPFEVLPTATRRRRLIDEYEISYLSAGRDVLRFGERSANQPGASVVAADPDFDLLDKQTPSEDDNTVRRQSRDLDRGGLHFDRLPGTRVEGESIAARLGVEPLVDDKVLESTLKALQSPRILHIATHGFFLPDQKLDPNDEHPGLAATGASALNVGRLTAQRLENPLLRSGLALAGANAWLDGKAIPAEAEDAILNAEDVLGLDLLDTELVVLSACETGLGEVRTGEGVFGLRRAFMLAGARTLVMSLWKVPDLQTKELMESFYQRILEGQPCGAALREAQLDMKKRYKNPLYWGAFICQGDSGPITLKGSKNE